jgi:hypothetical protein
VHPNLQHIAIQGIDLADGDDIGLVYAQEFSFRQECFEVAKAL